MEVETDRQEIRPAKHEQDVPVCVSPAWQDTIRGCRRSGGMRGERLEVAWLQMVARRPHVHSLDVRESQTVIGCEGGFQEEKVRGEICRVMEGGREAFESRYNRIMPLEGVS